MLKISTAFLFLTSSIIFSAPFSNAKASEIISIEDFVKLFDAKNVQISPDGKHLSVVFKRNGIDLLGVLDAKTRKVLSTFGVKGKNRGVGRVRWANNTRLIYSVTESYSSFKTVFETGELAAVNVDGSKHKLIFGYKAGERQVGKRGRAIKAAYGSQRIIDMLQQDEEHILIAFYPWRDSGRFWKYNPNAITTIYKLNIYTGKRIRIDSLPLPNSRAITDNNGKLRFSIGVNDENEKVVHYRNAESSKWIEFNSKDFEGVNVVPVSFTKDNNAVYLTANVAFGTRALYLFELDTQTYTKLFHDEVVNISRLVFDFQDKRIVAVGTELTVPKYHYLERKTPAAKTHRILQKSFKGSDVLITSATQDGNLVTAYVYSDTNPGDYYLFDVINKKAHYLLPRKSKIYPELMNPTELIVITTRDGEELRGYLTLPKNKTKKLPLVVMPHGGPHTIRDEWGYNWEVQLLSNRGYAVLQINYRGSGGFGIDFKEAGHGKWGTLMQDDITDATLEVIERGIADKQRVCIFGASYGGYAALMGAVREPELYKCVIGSAGVYNLPMMFLEGDIPDTKSGIAYLKEAIGENLQDQKDRSPVFNVAKIKSRVLLIHGAKDRRVPIKQAESLKSAFDDIGKKYEWLEIPHEGHGYYDEGNRLLVYTKVLQFLDESIGPKSH